MLTTVKLRQITLTYDCPILKTTLRKNVGLKVQNEQEEQDWYINHDEILIDVYCKCGNHHVAKL